MNRIEVIFDAGGVASAGIDYSTLIADIEAEVGKLASQVSVEPERTKIPAPPDAQSEFDVVKWAIDIAQDPKMVAIYAQMLIFAVNKILEAVRSKKKPEEAGSDAAEEKKGAEERLVEVRALGKAIILPATTLAIQEFLKLIVIGGD